MRPCLWIFGKGNQKITGAELPVCVEKMFFSGYCSIITGIGEVPGYFHNDFYKWLTDISIRSQRTFQFVDFLFKIIVD